MQQKLLGQKRATSPVGSSSMSEWLNCEWLLVNTLCAKEITVWKIGVVSRLIGNTSVEQFGV